uniref:Secreted protein n=1 Tax=Ditylenchus dipsaci TaxID=166011 RepID=A0A915DRZ9_9BILA
MTVWFLCMSYAISFMQSVSHLYHDVIVLYFCSNDYRAVINKELPMFRYLFGSIGPKAEDESNMGYASTFSIRRTVSANPRTIS